MSDKHVHLSAGIIHYRDLGNPEGPVLLFVHGLLVDGSLWDKVVAPLVGQYRCVVPDWPLGSHREAMKPGADLSPAGIADLIAEFIDTLGLTEVTLIGNDSGGALCQVVVTRHPERVARLVLTTCDAFEVFPPKLFAYLSVVARVPGMLWLMGTLMALLPRTRRMAIAYGRVATHGLTDGQLEAWTRPSRGRAVRRDLGKFIRAVSPRVTMEAARELPKFGKPALILWTPEDTSFPRSLGERLAQTLPAAQLVRVPDAWVFVAQDQPDAVAAELRKFVPVDHSSTKRQSQVASVRSTNARTLADGSRVAE